MHHLGNIYEGTRFFAVVAMLTIFFFPACVEIGNIIFLLLFHSFFSFWDVLRVFLMILNLQDSFGEMKAGACTYSHSGINRTEFTCNIMMLPYIYVCRIYAACMHVRVYLQQQESVGCTCLMEFFV